MAFLSSNRFNVNLTPNPVISVGMCADHILAATFLKKFLVNDPDWVHVDLSAGNHKGGLAHIPTDITGFGVRFTLNLLMDRKVIG